MKQTNGNRRWFPSLPILVLAVSAAIIVIISLTQDLVAGALETALLLMGLVASYVYGQQSQPGGYAKPHARKAYRRMATLSANLYSLSALVAQERRAVVGGASERAQERADVGLTFIEFAIGQNLAVVNDAMEDWADIVPEEAEELRKLADRREQDEEAETLEFNDEIGEDEEEAAT
jgi:hypothetical protein